jgi:hypothetical protein
MPSERKALTQQSPVLLNDAGTQGSGKRSPNYREMLYAQKAQAR